MAARAQPYRLNWPVTPETIEQIDEMLQILFEDLRNGNVEVTVAQGGTGLDSYAIGDILYGSAVDVLAALAIGGDGTYLRSTGTLPAWATLDLDDPLSGTLPFANLTNATAASKLLGRGSASGAGAFEEITLGSGLTMTATTLSAAAAAPTSYWAPLTDGDVDETELIYADGQCVMVEILL